MGKPFSSELEKLSATCDAAHAFSNCKLMEAVNTAQSGPVFLVGTGGSLSATEFATCLFDKEAVLRVR